MDPLSSCISGIASACLVFISVCIQQVHMTWRSINSGIKMDEVNGWLADCIGILFITTFRAVWKYSVLQTHNKHIHTQMGSQTHAFHP